MLEIIALIFLCKKNGDLAIRKGLKPGIWKFYTVIAWVIAELFGMSLIFDPLGNNDILSLMAIGITFAFGGFLLVHATLSKKPDVHNEEEDINKIGINDLRPPLKK